jgi:Trk K+ transport system NAD-binding subunit
VAIRRLHEVLTPDSSTVFREGDMLTVFCRTKHKEENLKIFDGVEIKEPKISSPIFPL